MATNSSIAKTGSESNSSAPKFLIVGIGASAGGVRALTEFFENVTADSGMAYVVILHLSPDFDSKLSEIIQAVTPIPVVKVAVETPLQPDHIYVVSPNNHLVISENTIDITPNLSEEDRRAPVDIFFRMLAEVHTTRAVCVVLSGTGANGSMGLKHVKELGGAAFVQNPMEAEFNEMPRNAIATELVDEVLPVADIPSKILAYKLSIGSVNIPLDGENRPEELQKALREVYTQLRYRTGHDFSNYKRPTLLRRIERRINIRSLPDLPAYAAFLQQNPDETNALLKDLLISVTNFFRDKKAFEVLEREVLPIIFKDKRANNQVRIWVAGCATGEEAYSIAMLCPECTTNLVDAPKIQIFATDIDESAISFAREGLYSLNDAADIPPERLRRFFYKDGEQFRVRREIREMILFANHNFLKDPPFSHLDLISCRNVLIYLNHHAQERVMETFHFALNSGGYLFLGSSESVDGANDLYSVYNREYHLFQTRTIPVKAYPVPETTPLYAHASQKLSISQLAQEPKLKDRITFGELHQRILEAYAPPSVIVNQEYEVVHLSERVGKYLHVAGGEPSQNLLKLVRDELRLELRSALYQAVQRQAIVEARGLKVSIDNHSEIVNILVKPVITQSEVTKGYILVLFEQATGQEETNEVILASDEPIARQLEEELVRLKAQLRSAVEQHEVQAEELKASNEELQAMNEELRSSTEELETSKEELQSINEELRTVNQELKVKVEETTHSSNNLQNLINSVDIATIFLDRSLCVALFTPAARDLFNLLPNDIGRPLSDITNHIDYHDITRDAEQVLEKLSVIEKEVRSDKQVFLMRVLPYRTSEDRINGVVITFFEVTKLKHTEQALSTSEERLRLLIENAKDYAIFTFDLQRRINSWSSGAEKIIGYKEEEVIGHLADYMFVPEDRENGAPEKEAEKAKTQGVAANERWHLKKDGSRFYGSGTVRPLYNDSGVMIGYVKIMRDLTETKKAEETLRESEERLRITLESAQMAAWDWDLQTNKVKWNKQHYQLLGLPVGNGEVMANYFTDFVVAGDRERVLNSIERALNQNTIYHAEFRIIRADNQEVRWMNGYGRVSTFNNQGKPSRMVGVMYEITEQKNLEEQREQFIAVASHELKTPVTSIKAYTELLLEIFEERDDEEAVDLLRKLNRQVNNFTDLIKDLLDITRISEGQLKLKFGPVNLRHLVEEKIAETSLTAQTHDIEMHLLDVPLISGDAERLGQVITNLLSNAIKYSPRASKIIVNLKSDATNAYLSVQDYGIGIPAHMHTRIFERFVRSHEQTETFAGLGLGLYISQEIMKRHNGSIIVNSNVGEGSIFTIVIPLQKQVEK